MGTRSFTDMMYREITISYPPKRIVSLVPSQTELLYDLGLDEEVIGITKFCVHPCEWFRKKKRIGGTKNVNIELVKTLQPDLIIANKEENTRAQIEELATLFPVWVSDIKTIDDGLRMIEEVGKLVGKEEKANRLEDEIRSGFDALYKVVQQKRVACFIWRKPWMCAGGDTFISDMINRMGWVNVLADKQRYPVITLQELKERNVEVVLLSSEPYPFKATHFAEIQAVLPGADIRLVDGEMMSWYGSRMLFTVEYVKGLIG